MSGVRFVGGSSLGWARLPVDAHPHRWRQRLSVAARFARHLGRRRSNRRRSTTFGARIRGAFPASRRRRREGHSRRRLRGLRARRSSSPSSNARVSPTSPPASSTEASRISSRSSRPFPRRARRRDRYSALFKLEHVAPGLGRRAPRGGPGPLPERADCLLREPAACRGVVLPLPRRCPHLRASRTGPRLTMSGIPDVT